MKTSTKIIIYDDTCPLCAAYTNAFIQTGFIAEENRKSFTGIQPNLLEKIDTTRCRNEIPVIDTETSQVWYGIDALLEILDQKIPFIKKIANIKPVKWGLHKLYKFVSYNRRVIVAPRVQSSNFDCTPDFNIPYRICFMILFLTFNTWMLYPLHDHVMNNSIFNKTSMPQLQLAHFSIVAINIIVAAQAKINTGIEYLGQINMLALSCMLLTLPLIMANKWLGFDSALVNNTYLFIVALLMGGEYIRRMKYLDIIRANPGIVAINVISITLFMMYLLV